MQIKKRQELKRKLLSNFSGQAFVLLLKIVVSLTCTANLYSAFPKQLIMQSNHHYALTINWTGNTGTGTDSYKTYDRAYEIIAENKVVVQGSSDPSFLGDRTKYNPEELLLASLSSCHMLWYLHLCSEAGVVVISYKDEAKAVMIETVNGGGKFEAVTLSPNVIVADPSMIDKANALHSKANELCFIANSVNFPIQHQPNCAAEKK